MRILNSIGGGTVNHQEYKARQKRNSILDAAVKAFRDEGYDHTTMDRIAGLAGASKRTVYNYFPSKKKLFRAVTDRLFYQLSKPEPIPYNPGHSLDEQLARICWAKLEAARDPQWLGLIQAVLSAVNKHPDLLNETQGAATVDEDELIEWLKDAEADGKMIVDDYEMAAKVFWSMIRGAIFWPLFLYGHLEQNTVEQLMGAMIATFLSRYARKDI
jgi:TetR/AcrR family transcriptional regulator of autoinduction and epiphytic fitness